MANPHTRAQPVALQIHFVRAIAGAGASAAADAAGAAGVSAIAVPGEAALLGSATDADADVSVDAGGGALLVASLFDSRSRYTPDPTTSAPPIRNAPAATARIRACDEPPDGRGGGGGW